MWYDLEWRQHVSLITPGAGASATRKIPGETFERLDVIRFQLTTSAAVANRFAMVDVLDGDQNVVCRVPSTNAVAASLTVRFTFIYGLALSLNSAANEQVLGLPDVLYPPGFTFRVFVSAMDAADQISNVFATVLRVPSDAWSPSTGATPYEP